MPSLKGNLKGVRHDAHAGALVWRNVKNALHDAEFAPAEHAARALVSNAAVQTF